MTEGPMRSGNSKEIEAVFDVAVVMPTIIRPSLLEAVASIYQQSFDGTVQILIGIDSLTGDPAILDMLEKDIPERMTLTVFNPGYSTATRHGGVHTAQDGGALRTILSFLANSQYVAYLDDDNLWHQNHLKFLMHAIQDKQWAYSYRWLLDEETGGKITLDKWHSVGPNKGVMQGTQGGFCDPNTLLIDKLACADLLHLWSMEIEGAQNLAGADRRFFDGLSATKSYGASHRATVYYKMRRTNILWQYYQAEKAHLKKTTKSSTD
ncbi:glycosyltransferase family 2 protein [Sneathiella sp.]|jgi:glycosyltransferase involved in cell wall biosynthesis|uniref:glycosyltransferase family 2 protein n=1 Tax=Sneathiella sp. TaxID=1964365 RepID=UPI0039E68C9E